MELGGNRLGNFSFGIRRVFVGCALLLCILAVVNYYLEWGLFGRFSRWAIAASFVSLFLVMRYLGPTVQEVRDYRSKAKAR
jgi:hypothetical protein